MKTTSLFTLTCWLGLAASAVAGSTNVVTTATDAALRSAIATGGWVSFTCNGTISLASSITIANNVILDGTGVNLVISGGGASQIFLVSTGATLCVTNLVLANGVFNSSIYSNAATGGAIENNGGTVSLVKCVLTNNAAINNTTVDAPLGRGANYRTGSAMGGALYNNGGILSLAGCTLSNNAVMSTYSYGGAVFTTNGTTTLNNCLISSNSCYYEDNYYAIGSGGYMSDHLSYGGAVCLNSGSLCLTNSTLAANLAYGADLNGQLPGLIAGKHYAAGGALASLAGTVNLDTCQFLGNTVRGGNENVDDTEDPGAGGGDGGAVISAGVLSATRTIFSGNFAASGQSGEGYMPAGQGGAVCNYGTAVFNNCQVSSNSATSGQRMAGSWNATLGGVGAFGGGIFNGGQLLLTNCTVALNTALGGTGYYDSTGTNTVGGIALGGGVFSTNLLVAMNVTIASNACVSPGTAPHESVGIMAGAQAGNSNGVVQLHNTLLAYGGTNANYYGPLTDLGYNLNSDASAPFTSGTSTNSLNPLLAPLANYGGPTLAMNLLPASPAIGTGDTNGAPATDQRGYYRYPAGTVDIGAVQFSGGTNLQPVIITQPVSQTVASGGTVSFSVSATGTAPFSYQWQQNGTNLPGATSAVLSFTNVPFSQSGYYYSATVTNASGSAASSNAWLTVTGPALTLNPSGTNFTLGFAAGSAKIYDLLVSSNLTTWTTQQVIGPFGTSSNFTLPLACPTNGARFYRLWQP